MNSKNSVKILILFCAMLVLIFNSPIVLSGAYSGLVICVSSVIPALFPFMVLSSAFVGNITQSSFKTISYISKKLFGFSPYGTGAFVCGMLCGYPIGAKCTAELYAEGKISSSEAETLVACSNNSGPLFIIGAVGTGMLASARAGVILYAIHIFWAFVFAIILRGTTYTKHIAVSKAQKSKSLTVCIIDSVNNMLNICGFIVFFAVVNSLIEPFISFLPYSIKSLCFSFVEITNGISFIASADGFITDKMILIALALGWSGLSVHMQVKNIVSKYNISMKKYYAVRTGIALMSALTCAIWAGKTDTVISIVPVGVLQVLAGAVCICSVIGLICTKRKESRSKTYGSLKS